MEPKTDGTVAACPACGQKNRIKPAATGIPLCASCGHALPWLVEVSTSGFHAGVESSPVPVLADFWAPWCAPCRMVAPVVERIATDLAGRLKVAKVNTDETPELGNRFNVRGIPTLILFENGREKDRITGAMPGPAMRSWVEQRLAR